MSFEPTLHEFDAFFASQPPHIALAMRYLILAALEPDISTLFDELDAEQMQALVELTSMATLSVRAGETEAQCFERVSAMFIAFADLLPTDGHASQIGGCNVSNN